MTLWQIAFKNVWQNRNRYIAYLGSSAFSVMIYFLYSSLVYHPELQSGYWHAAEAVQGMRAAAVVIAVFTFLFLLYSNSAFIRSRMKEFGLLSLLGVSKKQLMQIILLESFLIAVVALSIGLSFGMLLMKLFFMAISVLLQLPEQIPLNTGQQVWTHTLVVFCSFFVIVSLASLHSIIRRNIIELVRAGRQPKGTPKFSRWKTALGLVLVLLGYAWACMINPVMVVLGIIPVTAMVSIGTFFVIREGSIALLSFLHQRERLFYKPGPFLTISQLIHKMQENYRVLSAVTILVAVILSAMGTVFTLYLKATNDSVYVYPHAYQLARSGAESIASDVEYVNNVLKKHGLQALQYQQITVRHAEVSGIKPSVTLVPYSFYKSMRGEQDSALTINSSNQVIMLRNFGATMGISGEDQPLPADLKVDGHTYPITHVTERSGSVLNPRGAWSNIAVLSDELFATIMSQTSASQLVRVAIWDGDDWRSAAAQAAAAELSSHYGTELNGLKFSSTSEIYRSALSTMGLLLFIGFFVSLVFFAACCSLLYFRLFTEIENDREYFRQLQQVGVSNHELRQLALGQAVVVFLTPFVVGMIHSTFAMQALGTLMAKTVLQLGWMIALGYFVLYLAYFGATFTIYWRTLRAGLYNRNEAMSA